MVRKLKNLLHLVQAIFANFWWHFPSRDLMVIGVTGTDGKTTTVHLIHHILKTAGKKVDLISTVSTPGLHTTTPDPWVLQKLLRKMVGVGVKYLVLEATSHGLDQHRLFGIDFYLGVITNITHEHLDYHKTYENYLKAKSKLFRRVKIAVLNRDDVSYGYLKSVLLKDSKLVAYGIKNKADFTPKNFSFKTLLPGEYNQYNCLAAIAATSALGIAPEKIRQGLVSFGGVIGRMEEINEGQNFKVFIDFAHTPNGLEKALTTLGTQLKRSGRLIVVFGCAGLRDVRKRPMMGEIAARLADISVLTAEDPRTEDVNSIIEQIVKGCKKSFFRIPDRREAIGFAIQEIAKKDDIVVICGKGHERSMCFGKTEYPWSDQEEARRALSELKRNVSKN